MRKACTGLVEFIAHHYNCASEIGIGHFPDVAVALAKRGVRVFATDIKSFPHDGLKIIVDDITQPDLSVYRGIDLLYSMRPPPELVPYMNRLAGILPADLIVKPLASECPGGQLTHHRGSTFFFWKFS